MADAGLRPQRTVTAKLVRTLDERECARRNALSRTKPGFRLASGESVTVVETLSEAYLVEAGASRKDRCDWMGVLYPSELDMSV